MATIVTAWQPSWWKEAHGAAWALVRESARRDWQQTKHGAEPLPDATSLIDANPPLSLGEWHSLEGPYGYGFGARREFGAHHPRWNPMIEALLMSEWMTAHDQATRDWREVVQFVRRGYELEAPPNAMPDGQRIV